MSLPTLYIRDSKGKARQWSVWSESDTVISESGLVDGKKTQQRTKAKAKNIGKVNETTPESQALLESEAKWRKQVHREDYNEDIEKSGLQLRPMLAMDFKKVGHRLDWSKAIGQPKLDGLRLTAGNRNVPDGWNPNEFEFMSRKGETYVVEHLEDGCKLLLDWINKQCDNRCIALDGEVYLHGLPLQKISSRAKAYKVGLTEELEYHLFDLVIPGMEFWQRYELLTQALELVESRCIHQFFRVPLLETHDEDSMRRKHKECCEQGYEGIMIRHLDSEYKIAGRSADLFKYKVFYDDEFQIGDMWADVNGNGMLTLIIRKGFEFACEGHIAETDAVFNCTPKRTHKERKQMLRERDKWVGKWITVKYQDLTEDGIPSFNVGLGLRECDENGKPIF